MEAYNPQELAEGANALSAEEIVGIEHMVQSDSRITLQHHKIAISILFGIAILACASRLTIRLFTRRRLYIDDGFLLFSTLCLIPATVLSFETIHIGYLQSSIIRQEPGALLVALRKIDELYDETIKGFTYRILLWSTIFSIKWCYLAFFYPLLRSMSKKIIYYYWTAVTFSVVGWLYLITANQLIACPHLGRAAEKCQSLETSGNSARVLARFWMCPILDSITDLMVISIPILILRQSQMRILTKIGLGTFLCLSTVMIICAILRASMIHYRGAIDYPWQTFWLHAEACIAVSMASITVYRSVLVGSTEASDKLQSYLARVFGRNLEKGNGEGAEKTEAGLGKVKIEGWRISGLRTLFGGSKITRTERQVANDSGVSDLHSIETDYHAHIKGISREEKDVTRSQISS